MPKVDLDCAAGASGSEEDEAVGGEEEGVDCGAGLAVFVEAAVQTVFARSFRRGGSFEEADCGIVEADYDEVFLWADGYAAAPGGGGHAVLDGGDGGLDEVYDTKLENCEHL